MMGVHEERRRVRENGLKPTKERNPIYKLQEIIKEEDEEGFKKMRIFEEHDNQP